jgi:hypothetical protein
MIDREGNVRIMDFGIARSLSSQGITDSGVLVGTPEYMSPEQSLGEQVDQRSDIYSLGVILFELLTETLPFKADTSVGVALKHKTESPPNPKGYNKEIPDDLNNLVLKCLEKDKKKRFQNVGEIIETIETIKKGFPTTEKVLPDERTITKTSSKKPARLFMPLFFLIAIIIVVGILFVREKLPSKENEEAGAQSTSNNQLDHTQEGISNTGSINIMVTPPDAEIYIDDEKMGPAPLVHKLQSGFRVIRIRKYPLFKEISEEIEIKPGDKVVREYELDPLYVVEVETKPEGATVRLDGKFYGKTDKTPIKIESTVNTFQLDMDKGEEWIPFSQKVTLDQGLNKLISHTFIKNKYKLIITTDPLGALIYLWDKEQGLSPIELTILAGFHSIRIEKDGYETKKDTFTLTKDEVKNYSLTPLIQGEFKLIVFPIAQVFLDGEPIGEVSKIATFSFPVGKHTLEFVSKDLGKFTYQIEISLEETKTFHMNMETGEMKEIK